MPGTPKGGNTPVGAAAAVVPLGVAVVPVPPRGEVPIPPLREEVPIPPLREEVPPPPREEVIISSGSLPSTLVDLRVGGVYRERAAAAIIAAVGVPPLLGSAAYLLPPALFTSQGNIQGYKDVLLFI